MIKLAPDRHAEVLLRGGGDPGDRGGADQRPVEHPRRQLLPRLEPRRASRAGFGVVEAVQLLGGRGRARVDGLVVDLVGRVSRQLLGVLGAAVVVAR
ncbi:hypothetical protein [Amycolatopsis sp. NPDC049159]|uniref:hypothetical protein n=1 Tax=Amycolatopsis sp. NPDC049159 TaxID=3157210 RepID=UPI0033BFCAA2